MLLANSFGEFHSQSSAVWPHPRLMWNQSECPCFSGNSPAALARNEESKQTQESSVALLGGRAAPPRPSSEQLRSRASSAKSSTTSREALVYPLTSSLVEQSPEPVATLLSCILCQRSRFWLLPGSSSRLHVARTARDPTRRASSVISAARASGSTGAPAATRPDSSPGLERAHQGPKRLQHAPGCPPKPPPP